MNPRSDWREAIRHPASVALGETEKSRQTVTSHRMKQIALLIATLLVAGLFAHGQLTLNEGDTYTYQFCSELCRLDLDRETLRHTMENQLKANPQSEPAKTEFLRAHNNLQAAEEQQLLWLKEVARLEARLKEQKEQTSASPDTVRGRSSTR
jgi:hypothetical protein